MRSYKSKFLQQLKIKMHLFGTNTYGLSQNNPDDTFKKRWNSERAKVSPVVQGFGKQTARIEVCE